MFLLLLPVFHSLFLYFILCLGRKSSAVCDSSIVPNRQMPPKMATGRSYSYFRNGNIRQTNKLCRLVTSSISKAAVGDSRSNKAPCQLPLQLSASSLLVAHGEILVDAFIAAFGESAAW
ncbi:hypothetical protein M441DRAFT_400444 [Trichoderma asperellum CBS 433.97]|uniref:Secreted protein n=1 Tax=Trichoderma asperellum (strain ATCC 204424 / CBS 433.97 / NBRC 101777) TaxID=1042311 RepID=A0A2T3Z9P0_TRIA4|nr:hypothetical protein M441DRAFT_400444 [Trichoderma asperellum CBS 433.97]PTB41529.1 hypothetical protein M441DRAFT_400444 [Trichoderma asperellum CBS 433.97]